MRFLLALFLVATKEAFIVTRKTRHNLNALNSGYITANSSHVNHSFTMRQLCPGTECAFFARSPALAKSIQISNGFISS
jgi:hypothetical protein